MCLVLDKDKVAHTSDKDITCYKVVARIKRGDHKRYYSASVEHYISSYAKLNNVHIIARRYERNNRVIKEDDFINGVMMYPYTLIDKKPFVIDDGAIHSYAKLDDAILERKKYIDHYKTLKAHLTFCSETEYFIVKCTIPKGTPYYIGHKLDGDIENYASRELIFNTIIED